MGDPLSILTETGYGYYEEKRSRFPAAAYAVRSEEEALALIAAEKKKTYDARHHCWAYVLGPKRETLRFSDDGEPSGTAGKPILEVLLGQDIRDALIIVTRYFGGTLLGTGGLVRAYTAAAQDALAKAPKALVVPAKKVSVTCGYTDLARVDKIIHGDPSVFEGVRNYGAEAELVLYLTSGNIGAFAAALGDASSGRAGMTILGDAEIAAAEEAFLREYVPC